MTATYRLYNMPTRAPVVQGIRGVVALAKSSQATGIILIPPPVFGPWHCVLSHEHADV